MGIIVKRPVRIKVIVTDEFKARRTGEIQAALARLDVVGKQLAARIERQDTPAGLIEQLRGEQRSNEGARAAMKREIEKTAGLQIGSEYWAKTLAGPVEVEIGDDFSKLGACEIVVKDHKVIEIRDGLCPEVSETSL